MQRPLSAGNIVRKLSLRRVFTAQSSPLVKLELGNFWLLRTSPLKYIMHIYNGANSGKKVLNVVDVQQITYLSLHLSPNVVTHVSHAPVTTVIFRRVRWKVFSLFIHVCVAQMTSLDSCG